MRNAPRPGLGHPLLSKGKGKTGYHLICLLLTKERGQRGEAKRGAGISIMASIYDHSMMKGRRRELRRERTKQERISGILFVVGH